MLVFVRLGVVLCVFLSSLSATAALAGAAAPWPESAQGRPLPRPQWILVVPARRTANGSLAIWDRADEWARVWRVPRTIEGLRVVTLFGDSEDARSITAKAIDGMIIDDLEAVRRKYGAPAIALAVLAGDGAAVATWVPGYSASWSPVASSASVEESHERALRVVSEMLRGGAVKPAEAAAPSPVRTARVTDYRARGDGGVDYRVAVRAADVDAALAILRGLSDSDPVVEARSGDDAKVVVTSALELAGMKAALARAGFAP